MAVDGITVHHLSLLADAQTLAQCHQTQSKSIRIPLPTTAAINIAVDLPVDSRISGKKSGGGGKKVVEGSADGSQKISSSGSSSSSSSNSFSNGSNNSSSSSHVNSSSNSNSSNIDNNKKSSAISSGASSYSDYHLAASSTYAALVRHLAEQSLKSVVSSKSVKSAELNLLKSVKGEFQISGMDGRDTDVSCDGASKGIQKEKCEEMVRVGGIEEEEEMVRVGGIEGVDEEVGDEKYSIALSKVREVMGEMILRIELFGKNEIAAVREPIIPIPKSPAEGPVAVASVTAAVTAATTETAAAAAVTSHITEAGQETDKALILNSTGILDPIDFRISMVGLTDPALDSAADISVGDGPVGNPASALSRQSANSPAKLTSEEVEPDKLAFNSPRDTDTGTVIRSSPSTSTKISLSQVAKDLDLAADSSLLVGDTADLAITQLASSSLIGEVRQVESAVLSGDIVCLDMTYLQYECGLVRSRSGTRPDSTTIPGVESSSEDQSGAMGKEGHEGYEGNEKKERRGDSEVICADIVIDRDLSDSEHNEDAHRSGLYGTESAANKNNKGVDQNYLNNLNKDNEVNKGNEGDRVVFAKVGDSFITSAPVPPPNRKGSNSENTKSKAIQKLEKMLEQNLKSSKKRKKGGKEEKLGEEDKKDSATEDIFLSSTLPRHGTRPEKAPRFEMTSTPLHPAGPSASPLSPLRTSLHLSLSTPQPESVPLSLSLSSHPSPPFLPPLPPQPLPPLLEVLSKFGQDMIIERYSFLEEVSRFYEADRMKKRLQGKKIFYCLI